MNRQGEIYIITNTINCKRYVGQVLNEYCGGKKAGSLYRWDTHCKNAFNHKNSSRCLEAAIRKYGKKLFTIEILLTCGCSDLNYYEDRVIDLFNTLVPNGYNLMTGGGNGRVHHKSSREKMSETRTGKQHSELTKMRIGKAHENKIVESMTRLKISDTSRGRSMPFDRQQRLDIFLTEYDLPALPMYMSYSEHKSRDTKGFCIRKPNCNNAYFMAKNENLIEKYNRANNYLSELNGRRSEGRQPQ